MGNIYALIIECTEPTEVKIGSIGFIKFVSGYYVYIGSSKSENFKRVIRHKNIISDKREVTHWHIDYLNTIDETRLDSVFISRDIEECELSRMINLRYISGFGCSDCNCDSHLYYVDEKSACINELNRSIKNLTDKYEYLDKNVKITEENLSK